MERAMKYPILEVNLDAVRENAEEMCAFCMRRGMRVAGVIKFSDGNVDIAGAYHEGGCSQIASSRTVHLKRIRHAIPEAVTMLIRIPMPSETEEVVQWCDISLNSEEKTLRLLNDAAGSHGKSHGILLMLDVGDRREGVIGTDRLCELAVMVEREMAHLKLVGVGSSFACVSGVLPDQENLRELAAGAKKIEAAIGRKLDIVSGGSSISLTMLAADSPIPPEINHLRIGGAIANPIGIRRNRGVFIEGMREDAFKLTAEIVEIGRKPSAVQGTGGPGKNWAGQTVVFEDKGVRTRAVIALGSQDVGDATSLIPLEEGVTVIGGSSDHTVLDITDSGRDWKVGDPISFSLLYMNLLYCFATRHVSIVCR